jgi:hypothetical protein
VHYGRRSWDRGDPISGVIDTVAGDVIREQRVDNVQLASYVWPDPAASHQGYFMHRDVLSTIFHSVFLGELGFLSTQNTPGTPPKRTWLGPGRGSKRQRASMLLVPVTALLVIWAAAARVTHGLPPAPVGTMAGLFVALIVGAWVQRRLRLHQAPVPFRPPSGGKRPRGDRNLLR